MRVCIRLSPRKLHPVLRIKCSEKDRFTTQQQNHFFFQKFIKVFLGCVKEMAFQALRTSVFQNGRFCMFYSALSARGLARSR